MELIKKNNFLSFLESPKAMILGIIIGTLLGIFFKPLAVYVKPLANSYFSLITMCILPIIFTSVITGLADLLKITKSKIMLKIMLFFLGGLLIISFLCAAGGTILKPTLKFNSQNEAHIASIISSVEEYPSSRQSLEKQQINPKLADFLNTITPDNIFAALAEGLSIKVLIVAILIGIASGKIKGPKASNFIALVGATKDIFDIIFKWMLYLLPLGLCFAFTSSLSSANVNILKASLQIIGLIYLLGIILLAIYLAIICITTKKSIFSILKILKEPTILGFLTSSYFIPIPATIKAFKNRSLNLNPSLVELIVPLFAVVNHHGKILLLSVLTIFVAKFYGIDLNTPQLIMALFTATILGAFAVGQGMLLAPVFMIIAKTLGIPPDIGILFLVAITPVISNLQTLVTIFANFSLTVLLAKDSK